MVQLADPNVGVWKDAASKDADDVAEVKLSQRARDWRRCADAGLELGGVCTGAKSYGPASPLAFAVATGTRGDATGRDGIGGGGEGDLLGTLGELRLLDRLLIGLRDGRKGGGGCERRCISSIRNHSDELCVIRSCLRLG